MSLSSVDPRPYLCREILPRTLATSRFLLCRSSRLLAHHRRFPSRIIKEGPSALVVHPAPVHPSCLDHGRCLFPRCSRTTCPCPKSTRLSSIQPGQTPSPHLLPLITAISILMTLCTAFRIYTLRSPITRVLRS